MSSQSTLRVRRFSRRVRAGWVIGCSALIVIVLAACGSSGAGSTKARAAIPAGPIKVAGIYPLSGPLAAFGKEQKLVEATLIASLNKHGGIAGHTVDFISENDQGDPAQAASIAHKLISEGVSMIVCPGASSEAAAALPIFMKAHVPVLTGFNPGDKYVDATKWPFYFATGVVNKENAQALVSAAARDNEKKIGIAVTSEDIGEELGKDVEAAASQAGIKVVKTVQFDLTAVDLTSQMAQLRSAGADAVLIGGGGGYSAAFSALRTLGWKPRIYADTAVIYYPNFAGVGDLARNTVIFCDMYCLPKGQKPPAALAGTFRSVEAEIGKQPDIGYPVISNNDSLLLFKYAVEKTHTLNGDAIKSALETVTDRGFTVPGLKRTYTSKNHAGLGNVLNDVAVTTGLGPYGVPVLAANSPQK